MRQVDVAAHPCRSDGADARRRAGSVDTEANGLPGLVAYQPQRDLLLPWRRVLGNATLGAEVAGSHARRGPPGRDGAFRALRARRLRPSLALVLVRRHAPAGRALAHVPRAASGAPARRTLRRARRDHAPHDAGVAARGVDGRRPHGAPRHARRRGGPAPGRSGHRDVEPTRAHRRRPRRRVPAPTARPSS